MRTLVGFIVVALFSIVVFAQEESDQPSATVSKNQYTKSEILKEASILSAARASITCSRVTPLSRQSDLAPVGDKASVRVI